MCVGDLVSVKGSPPIVDLDTCLAEHQRALPLIDVAESACQGRSDVLKEIAAYRRHIQQGQKTLEIAKGVRTGKISPVGALQRLLEQVPDDK